MPPPDTYDLKGFQVHGLVVHELQRGTTRLDPATVPTLSTTPALNDPDTLDFLTLQVKNGMIEGAYPATFRSDSTSAAPELIRDLLREGQGDPLSMSSDTLMHVSSELATSLQLCQEHNSPAGMFAMCPGRVRDNPVVVVMKLESQRGLRLVRERVGGDMTMTLEVQPDLFVGNKAKLFKAATFMLDRSGVRVMICDEQFENRPSHPAAQYFVGELLGCTIDEDLGVRTARFVDAVAKAANEILPDADSRAQVLTAVRAELGSNRRTIDPPTFIAEHFPEDKRSEAEAHVRRNSVDMTKFTKDSRKVDKYLRRTTFRFSEGPTLVVASEEVRILGPDEAFDDSLVGVQVRTLAGTTTAVIRGVVDGVTPRS